MKPEQPNTTYTIISLCHLRTEAVDIGTTSLHSCGESALLSDISDIPSGISAGTLYGPSLAGNRELEPTRAGKCLLGAGEGALDTLRGPEALEQRESGRPGLMEGGR